tara:strand:+ start:566 stop:1177 length:612 start_codon:yes stop_codon:yes gene_type:complete
MLNERIFHFLKVSITVYIFYTLIYAVWSYLQILDLANLNPNKEWLGSICYLPHGVRVLMFCFFRYYSIPALYLAEITSPVFVGPNDYVDGWNVAAIGSVLSVIIAVELIKWSKAANGTFSLFRPINFKNYKFIILVIIISSLINGLLANSIITVVNPNVTIEVITVMRFFIGDILGSLSVMLAIWVIFTTLVDTRLIISPERE